jgi:hypothetical protein
MLCVVTGFVPIPDHPRPEAEYRKLGERLAAVVVPPNVAALIQLETNLTDCWLYKWMEWQGQEFRHSVSDNPRKNTSAYLIAQSQKIEFLSEAARHYEADVFMWLDWGIFHLRGLTDEILIDFFWRAKHERVITMPGCWDKNYTYTDDHPCWRFAGGVWIVPRKWLFELEAAMKTEYIRGLKEGRPLTWEVNVLSRLERQGFPLWWYGPCDHDASLFTVYKGTVHA